MLGQIVSSCFFLITGRGTTSIHWFYLSLKERWNEVGEGEEGRMEWANPSSRDRLGIREDFSLSLSFQLPTSASFQNCAIFYSLQALYNTFSEREPRFLCFFSLKRIREKLRDRRGIFWEVDFYGMNKCYPTILYNTMHSCSKGKGRFLFIETFDFQFLLGTNIVRWLEFRWIFI